jgi:hypothetical protein
LYIYLNLSQLVGAFAQAYVRHVTSDFCHTFSFNLSARERARLSFINRFAKLIRMIMLARRLRILFEIIVISSTSSSRRFIHGVPRVRLIAIAIKRTSHFSDRCFSIARHSRYANDAARHPVVRIVSQHREGANITITRGCCAYQAREIP